MKTTMEPEFLSISELMKRTGLSKYIITKMIKEGMPCHKFGNRITVKREDFDQWVEENHRIDIGNTKRDFNNIFNETLMLFTN